MSVVYLVDWLEGEEKMQNNIILDEFKNILLKDKRMNGLFFSNKLICLQVWAMELQKKSQVDYHFLYGRVLPYDYQNDQWTSDLSKHNKAISIDAELNARVIFLQLTTSAKNLNTFIINLLHGCSFLESSTNISVLVDEKLQKIFDLLRLPFPNCIRPVMHLPPRDSYVWDTSKCSPSSEASYDSAAISLINKDNIWNLLGISRSQKILALIHDRLKSENIDITGIDAWRLGDLEFLYSPGLTNQEKVKFHLELKKQNKLDFFEKISEYPLIIILKLFNGESLLFTSIQEIKISEYPSQVEFNIDEYCNELFNSYTLEIFEKNDYGTILLAQEGHTLVRTINFQSNLISNISDSENDPWLEKGLAKSSLDKVKGYTTIERLSHHHSEFSVNGNNKDLWFDSNIKITSYLNTILPSKSNSHFFQKLSLNDESRIELVEWLKMILHKYPKAQVAWFDPFMEDVGINLLNRLGFDTGNYIIFTSQVNGDSNRINNLVMQCEKWAKTIGSVKLKVIGLDKLHDRMILVREQDGKPLLGYHLSNSIQRANENNPLLVTEIPLDVLYPVFSYVDELINSQNVANKPSIFDSTAYQPKNQNEVQSFDTKSLYQFSKLGWVLAKWWQNPALEDLSEDILKNFLHTLELDFETHKEKYITIPSFFFDDPFSSDDFVEEWNAFGHLLAHTPSDKYSYEIENTNIRDTLVSKLVSYLDSIKKNGLPLRYKGTVLDLNRYLKMSFYELICNESPERVFQYELNEISYSDYYAIKFLWCCSPKQIIAWLDEQLSNFNKQNARQRALLSDALRYICGDFYCLEKWILLFKSNHHLLKWIAAKKIFSLFVEGKISSEKICQLIDENSKVDKTKILFWFIRESVLKKNKFDNIFLIKIIETNSSISNNELKDLLDILRGRLGKLYHTYCWILEYILEHMVSHKIISYRQIMDFWIQDLELDWNKAISNSHNHVCFNKAKEGKFSDEIIYLFSKLSEDEKYLVLYRFNKLITSVARIIRKPLSKSINYSLYKNAFQINVWMLAIFNKLSVLELSAEIASKIETQKLLLLEIYQRNRLSEISNNSELLSYYYSSSSDE